MTVLIKKLIKTKNIAVGMLTPRELLKLEDIELVYHGLFLKPSSPKAGQTVAKPGVHNCFTS